MNYISANVKVPEELDIKYFGAGDDIGIILDYTAKELYRFEYENGIRYFRPYIGKIQDILLIGISWLAVPEIEENFLSDNPTFGIAIQIDFPKKGQISIIYKEFPKEEFRKIDSKKFILVELLLIENNKTTGETVSFWGSLDKSIFPERSRFDEKWKEIHKILETDYLTMGLSALMMTNKLKIFNIKYI